MGNYSLVASFYNRKTKKYEREMAVKVLGYDFSKLQDIDRFTLGKGNLEMTSIIKQQNDVGDRNFISIKYIKNSSATPVYYRVINDNRELLSVVNGLVLVDLSQKKYTDSIDNSNSFFRKEKEKLIRLIEDRDYDMLDILVGESGRLRFLIDRYLNSFYDNSEQDIKIRDLSNIVLEFSRYKTFRKWIVNNMKYKEGRIKRKSTDLYVKRDKKVSKVKMKEIKREEYVQNRDDILKEYNEDNDEFLESDEISQMGIFVSDEESAELFCNFNKRKRK